MKRRNVARLSVAVNQYELDLFNEALNTIGKDCPLKSEKPLLLRQCIFSFCIAVIKQGRIVYPPAVDLRPETDAETEARVHCVIPVRGSEPSPYIVPNRQPKNVIPFPMPETLAARMGGNFRGEQ